MLRAVTIILTLTWLGLLVLPALADGVGLAGCGALVAVLLVDRARAVRRGQWGRDDV